MLSSDGLTDPNVDQKTSKLISMFPLSWATVGSDWRWHETVGSEGDDSLRSPRCKIDQKERGKKIKDPSEGIFPISYMFHKS